MRTKTSSHPIDEAVQPLAASSLKTGQVSSGWRKRGQVVGAMLAGFAPTGRIASDDEFSTLEALVARLEAENASLQRQIQIYRELCVAD